MTETRTFYNNIAECYHLIYSDWEQSISNQATRLSAVIERNWRSHDPAILDCTCGIGTQSLGLAARGYRVTGSDLSEKAISRARREARKRKLSIDFAAVDVRNLSAHFHQPFDVVISCDNSLPHLLTDSDIRKGLRQIYRCMKPGGGAIISVRDYEKEDKAGLHLVPYGVRQIGKTHVSVFQVREFYKRQHYRVGLYFVYSCGSGRCRTKVFTAEYYAIPIGKLMELMRAEGFRKVRRIDDEFFQPIIVGSRARD
jgi:SAM-dependent methyltransferase